MYCKTITYEDYNGTERTEKFYFNLTKAELTEMEMSTDGGMETLIKRITETKDGKELIKMFKSLIIESYGVKSDDGRRFIKNDEVRDSFAQTEAYSQLFMELATNADEATKFVNGIMPKDLVKQYQEAEKQGKIEPLNK